MPRRLLAAFVTLALAASAKSATLNVYGPGGPAPAVKEAALAFQAHTGVTVNVVAGPTPAWIDSAKSNADVIFSGSETMMSDFVGQMAGAIDPGTVRPLYLRPSAILVRPGNPGHIHGLKDLFKPGHRVLVVNGAGQNGLWEDMAGRLGDIRSVSALRSNIVVFAKTSADAKTAWSADPSLDAWIIWNIWQVSNPKLADTIAVEPQYRIYRDSGVALTHRGEASAAANAFCDFLSSSKGAAIFRRWGWLAPTSASH